MESHKQCKWSEMENYTHINFSYTTLLKRTLIHTLLIKKSTGKKYFIAIWENEKKNQK